MPPPSFPASRVESIVVTSTHRSSCRVLGHVDCLLILSYSHTAYCGDSRCHAAFGCPVSAGKSPAEFALDAVRSLELDAWHLAEFNAATTEGRDHGEHLAGDAGVVAGGGGDVAAHGNQAWVEVGALNARCALKLLLTRGSKGRERKGGIRIALARNIVVASVHQPSSRVLGAVDHLLILLRGRAAYCCEPCYLANFLAAFERPVPAGESPAEFALDVVCSLELGALSSLAEFNAAAAEGRDRSKHLVGVAGVVTGTLNARRTQSCC